MGRIAKQESGGKDAKFELCDIYLPKVIVFVALSIGQKERKILDALTILDFVIKKVAGHGVRHGENEAQREYPQAKD